MRKCVRRSRRSEEDGGGAGAGKEWEAVHEVQDRGEYLENRVKEEGPFISERSLFVFLP